MKNIQYRIVKRTDCNSKELFAIERRVEKNLFGFKWWGDWYHYWGSYSDQDMEYLKNLVAKMKLRDNPPELEVVWTEETPN